MSSSPSTLREEQGHGDNKQGTPAAPKPPPLPFLLAQLWVLSTGEVTEGAEPQSAPPVLKLFFFSTGLSRMQDSGVHAPSPLL